MSGGGQPVPVVTTRSKKTLGIAQSWSDESRLEYFDAIERRKKNIRTNCNNLIEASSWSESQVGAQSINREPQVLHEARRSEALQSVPMSQIDGI